MVSARFKAHIDRSLQTPLVEIGLVGLILISVVLVVLEVVLEAQGLNNRWVQQSQTFLTSIFVVELLLRYWVARKKRRFWRQYWLDILAVMPFVHAFRLLRLLRMLRLLRAGILLNRSLNRTSSAIATSLGIHIGVFMVIGLIVLTGGLTIYLFEAPTNPRISSLTDALWWSILSLVAGEPIGAEPRTHIGRGATLLVMMGGLTTFAIFTGVVSAVMMQKLTLWMDFKALEIDELRGHVVICGWNRSGHLIIEELLLEPRMRHCPIVVVAELIEAPEQALANLNRSQLYFYTGDYTKIEVLKTVGITHASRAILLADSSRQRTDQDRDARTVLAALTIEKLNSAVYTCAQLLDRQNDVQLKIAGVDDVIVEAEVASHLIATSARNLGSVQVLAELLTVQTGNQIYQVSLPMIWQGKTFGEVSTLLKQQFDALVIAVEQSETPDQPPVVNPPRDMHLTHTDQLVIIARQEPAL